MMPAFFSQLRRILRREDGTVSMEFVIIFPVIAIMIVMTLELGFITLRQTLLDRGLDMAVREVRLGTGEDLGHDTVKELVCENAMFLPDCANQLFLEMAPSNPRSFTPLHETASCTDEPIDHIRPAQVYHPGQENQIVMMRACVLYDPIFPKGLLPRKLKKTDDGKAALLSVTAFVQEPI